MIYKLYSLLGLLIWAICVEAQVPQPIRQLLRQPYMEGASFSLMVKEVESGRTLFAYDTLRQMTPASVMKSLTTATALELLGEDFRFPTTIEYDGSIKQGCLHGNLYIKGSGDPSLGSSFLEEEVDFMAEWIAAIRNAGIQTIEGAVIADEQLFDTEGTSLKWVAEDMGADYGAGSYGLNVFDNRYKLGLQTGEAGSRPQVKGIEPWIDLRFHNYMIAQKVATDSCYIMGVPFSNERYLYGVVPAGKAYHQLQGNIPDPPAFLADYLTKQLRKVGIKVKGTPSCYRLLQEAGEWPTKSRKPLITTYSPPLSELVRITNFVSHNLFADALLKTIGLCYQPKKGEVISSFSRGVKVLRDYWEQQGLDVATLYQVDGSGLAAINKLSTAFITDFLCYMRKQSVHSTVFNNSLPRVGFEGSVRNFWKGNISAKLKSGSMTRVKGYAGYVTQAGKEYAIALFVNHYGCDGKEMNRAIEKLLNGLFMQ
ncbi:MAG: D-alanyl-D-alanine carboxypeptidase/D-alanyl-D-alanine-endopeptidase [Parabacteroides sp.]